MKGRAAPARGIRRVQQLQLDVGVSSGPDEIARRPRPIKFAIANTLGVIMPSPSEAYQLCELTSPERQTLYRLAGIQPLEQITYEENLRRWRRGRGGA